MWGQSLPDQRPRPNSPGADDLLENRDDGENGQHTRGRGSAPALQTPGPPGSVQTHSPGDFCKALSLVCVTPRLRS